MPMPPAMAQDLGNLIDQLNPYTDLARPGYPMTGGMNVYGGNPAPTVPPTGSVGQIHIEVDSKYPGEWSFKGEPQHVSKAVRIRYRFPVLSGPLPAAGATGPAPTVLYWIDDYLLIGFEGANGGG